MLWMFPLLILLVHFINYFSMVSQVAPSYSLVYHSHTVQLCSFCSLAVVIAVIFKGALPKGRVCVSSPSSSCISQPSCRFAKILSPPHPQIRTPNSHTSPFPLLPHHILPPCSVRVISTPPPNNPTHHILPLLHPHPPSFSFSLKPATLYFFYVNFFYRSSQSRMQLIYSLGIYVEC